MPHSRDSENLPFGRIIQTRRFPLLREWHRKSIGDCVWHPPSIAIRHPFDHPHIYMDMGKDSEVVCPYCSTHYVFNSRLAPGTSNPASAVFHADAA